MNGIGLRSSENLTSASPLKSRKQLSLSKLGSIASWVAIFSAAPAHAASLQRMTDDLNYSLESLMDHVMPQGVTDVRIGVGTAFVPKYEGDNNIRLIAAPVLSARYKDIISLDGAQLRFNLFDLHQSPGSHPFSAGPMIRLDFGRDESDSRDLRGLGDVGASFEMGGFVNYNIGPGRIRATIRQDVANGHKGAIATVDAGMVVYRTNKLVLAAQTGLTWASGHYMQTFFGITPLQSVRSGLPVYTPGSGLKSWSITGGR